MKNSREPICVSVINMKGGVGKTTVTALLGRHAAYMDLRVLAIDLDPQANLSQAYMGDHYREFLNGGAPSIVEVFDGYRPPNSDSESPTRLDPTDAAWDVFTDGTLAYIPSRFDFSDNLVHALKPDPQVLARSIADYFQDKDLVLIDCPPTESVFTRAAYHASRHVVVPVQPEYFATIGFPLLSQSLATFRSENPSHSIDVFGVVINNRFYHGGNDGGPEKWRAMEEIEEECAHNGWHVFENQIPHSRGFPKLMRGDRKYLGNAPDGFRRFAEEFFNLLGFGVDK